MANYAFNVNTEAAIELTHKLEKLSRSAFPLAVRGTLNAAAFDMKVNTLQQSAKDNFIIRAPTFFKRFTSVRKANGFNVNGMQAAVGFTPQGVTTAQTPIANLAKQEEGGTINDELYYLKGARGGNPNRLVTRANRFNKNNFVRGSFKRNFSSTKSRFVAQAYIALKEKKKLFFKSASGKGFTLTVTSINKTKKGKLKINTKLISVNRDHSPINIKATHFNREAAMETLKKIPAFYQAEAKRQFAKVLK